MSSAATERTTLLPTGACSTLADETLAGLPVFYTVHRVHDDICREIDVGMSHEQLHSPEMAFAIIQPLEAAYAEHEDPSIVFVLLLNRLHFIRERDSAMASFSLNDTRAQLCEMLAIRLLRHQATGCASASLGLLAMAKSLVGGFHPFQGADDDVMERIRQKEGYTARMVQQGAGETNALELAILGEARNFIKATATQRVITAIWEGRIVYSASSFLDILPDRWKLQQISLYRIQNAPILDHYRLRVPKYRSIIELFSFVVLFVSFLAVVLDRKNRHEHLPVSALTGREWWFFLYTLGYSLDKIASVLEHGWSVYSAGLTNGLDALCIPIFGISFAFRIYSVAHNDAWAGDQAFAVLSCAACFMFPRLAFALISNNVLILSLRAMLADFAWLMGIAVFCFLGFVFALNHLCDGLYSVARISEYLIFIWFGLDGKGIDVSGEFHPLLGPVLFITYAALSNTLLVSLLVAILSGTYAGIAADAAAEDMFRKAVMTFEGVKCDSLFDYVAPLNIPALLFLFPLSKIVSARWFHKINVALTRLFSLPILLLIALYERQTVAGAPIRHYLGGLKTRMVNLLPVKWSQRISLLEGAHWEARAVFAYAPAGEKEDDDGDLSEDEVQDSLEATAGRAVGRVVSGSRASIVITPVAPVTPKPIPFPSRERLPSNATGTRHGHTASARPDADSALSTSPHYTSHLAKLYQHGDSEVGGGLRRRMSLGVSARAPELSTPAVESLMIRLEHMTATISRLEERLNSGTKRD